MKKLVLLGCFLFTLSAKGQTMVDTNKIWHVLECMGGPFGSSCSTVIYKFMDDTTIGSYHYRWLYKSNDSLMSYWYPISLMRQDSTKKVYAIDYWGNDELFYDFGLNKNDTFNICLYPFPLPMVVDSVDTVMLLNGESRKRLFLDYYPPDGYHNEIWIDGVGGLFWRVFLHPCVADIGYELNCFSEDNILKYYNLQSAACYWIPGIVEKEAGYKTVSISPNPFHTTATLTISDSRFTNYDLRIYNLMGQLVKEQTITQKAAIINREGLSDGLYFYELAGNREGCPFELVGSGKMVVE